VLTQRHIVPPHVAGEHGSTGSVLLESPVSPNISQNLVTEKEEVSTPQFTCEKEL